MKFLLVCSFLLFNGIDSRSSGGHSGGHSSGGHSSGGSHGGRGSSAARLSSRGGSFSHGSSSVSSFHGANYHVPASSSVSQSTFHTSIHTSNPSMITAPNGHIVVHSTSEPMHVNNNNYYFGTTHYYYHTSSSSSSSHSSTHMCSVPLSSYEQNAVPLDTSLNSNSTDYDDFGNSTQSLYDIIKNENNTFLQTTTTASTTTTTVNSVISSTIGAVVAKFDFLDGKRPKDIVWSCPNTEACCYMECCPRVEDDNDWVGLIIIMVIILCIVGYIAGKKLWKRYLRSRQYTYDG